MTEAPNEPPMFATQAETIAFNRGVEAVLAIAAASASAISNTSRRRVHEDFAVAALLSLKEAGSGLLLQHPGPTAAGQSKGEA